MKRNILILTIVFLLVGYPVFSSHAILDAIALFKELQNFKTAEKGTNENISTYTNISKILVNYRDFHSNEHPSNIINSFIGKKNQNAYFRLIFGQYNLIENYYPNHSSDKSFSGTIYSFDNINKESQSSSFQNNKGTITNIADGIASFILDRAQQEAADYLLVKYNDCLVKYPEIDHLLPRSSKLVKNNLNNSSFKSIFDNLYIYFKYDIKGMPSMILSLSEIPLEGIGEEAKVRISEYQKFFDTPEGICFLLLNTIFSNATNEKDVFLMFNNIETAFIQKYKDKELDKNSLSIISSIRILKILFESISNKNNGFVSLNDIEISLKNDDIILLYFGLIYEDLKAASEKMPLQINGNSDFLEYINPKNAEALYEFIDSFNLISNYKDSLIKIYSKLQNIVSTQKEYIPENENALYMQILDSTEALTDLLKTISETNIYSLIYQNLFYGVDIDSKKRDSINSNFNLTIKSITYGLDIGTSIYLGDYVSAFNGIIQFVSQLNQKYNVPGLEKVYKSLLSSGAFLTEIVNAKDGKEVESILNTYSLSSASYRLKYKNSICITINSYIGAIYTADIDLNSGYKSNFGLFAPVGLSMSLKTEPGCMFSSFSIFLGLIDVGAIASYRYESSTAILPEINIKDIFSISYNNLFSISDSPFSIGFGIRLGPALREITTNGNIVIGNNPLQASVFAVVDVPIIKIY